jgi:signal transduction histidine kinase
MRASNPGRAIALETRGDSLGVCDEERFAQAFSNQLGNVGNALKCGAADVPVTTTMDGSSVDEIAVSVPKAVPPTPKATRDSLFEPLVRAHQCSSRPGKRGGSCGTKIHSRI